MISEEDDRKAARIDGSHIDGSSLDRAQKMFEDGLQQLKQGHLDAALEIFGKSARLFSQAPNGETGYALCLSYSGVVFSQKEEGEQFTAKSLALLFSEGAVQAAQGEVGPDSEVFKNHAALMNYLSATVGPLENLKALRAKGCSSLVTLPNNLNILSKLQILNL